eukprot:TRINITY_DN2290_c0_g1_i1.p1 TRINITY_DN2290_c0_g1~~TRINITY_DN2290_c0_g1_i1.p1  ORF type:complete len:285 (+),score=66.43 TRINITY_DN2290_c0_g1_i1:54-908(+)
MSDQKAEALNIGTTITKVSSAEEVKVGEHCFSDESADHWKIRSVDFMSDKVKVTSEASILKVYNCDIFRSQKKVSHIMERMNFPTDLPQIKRSADDGDFYLPKLMVVNFMIPLYSTNAFWRTDDGDSIQFVFYLQIDQDAYDGMREERNPAYRLLKDWLQVHPTSADDYQNRGRLKAIPEILNVDEINLGLLRPVVLANSAKPFLTGPKYHDYVKTDDYLEVDVDIHRYTYAARNTLFGMLTEIPRMLMRFGLVVEGRNSDELPEQLLAGICLKADQNKALIID